MPKIPALNFIGTQYYQTQLGIYDEMFASENHALPHWERLMSQLDAVGSDKLENRRREAQRLLLENGVTYNVYGDSQQLTRPWQLDPVPLLISSDEWLVFEAGLLQRAELLNLILKDIYGEQKLLKTGLLPAELIYCHAGFLTPCVDALTNQKKHLILYAVNLARGPNGRMWVLDDRTQAPSGSGYALENRAVMSRILPDLFRDTPVHRLSRFFKSLQAGLTEIAPHNKDDPRIVILTPGPFNETYFEHAYLAAFLGYTLVQGGDLTVRYRRLWLKSLTGLLPVDVVVRRVDDSYCDPLELRSNSQLGIPGLLEVVRSGNVALANPLGSSVLENPGLLAFLPGLARYFFNEELILPSIATWWCGQAREREFVLNNFDNLVIKPINRSQGYHAIFPKLLSNEARIQLRDQILAKPHLYVGQEQAVFSTLPSLIERQIEPRHAVLRNFIVANGRDYVVMPGGLTRIAVQKDNFIVSNQSGGISKDTWVLASETQQFVKIAPQIKRNQATEGISESLTSRAADNLFWVGRYIERIEASARLFRIVLHKFRETFEFKDANDRECLKILLKTLTRITGAYPGFSNDSPQVLEFPQTELIAVAVDPSRPGSLANNIHAFKQSAYNIRDFWSQETWRCIDRIQLHWQNGSSLEFNIEHLNSIVDNLINELLAFTGLTADSMTRESSWLMLDSGRRLERSLALITLLRATLVNDHEDGVRNQLFETVLIATDSFSIYQRRNRSYLQLPRILDLILLDETHPRSLAYQLSLLSKHLALLPRAVMRSRLGQEERLIMQAYTDLKLSNLSALTQLETNPYSFIDLDRLLFAIANLLLKLSEAITKTYFSHTKATQMMILSADEEEL